MANRAVDSRDLAGRKASHPSAAAERLILAGVELARQGRRTRDGSPVGRRSGESPANVLALYLAGRYAVRRSVPGVDKGGLPGRRLKRVLDYIGDNLTEDLSLSQLAAVAGMSPHYSSELFRQSTGHPPHRFVLSKRIERAKEKLRDCRRSVIGAGLEAGFQNPSHFARTFRRLVGVTPRQFRGSA